MALQFQKKLNSNFVGLYRVQNKTDFSETKIFKSVSEYLSNESEKSKFRSGNKNYGQNNFQKGRYRIYIALKNRHFSNNLKIRRNHFCWIRDVKLLLGFKFHNF